MSWQVRSSNKMLVLGMILIVCGFVLMWAFFKLSFHLDRFVMWLYVILIELVFGLGLFSILAVRMKEVVRVLLIISVWSCVLLIPVPQGYEEPIYGGSLISLVAIIIIYDNHRKSKRKNPAKI